MRKNIAACSFLLSRFEDISYQTLLKNQEIVTRLYTFLWRKALFIDTGAVLESHKCNYHTYVSVKFRLGFKGDTNLLTLDTVQPLL